MQLFSCLKKADIAIFNFSVLRHTNKCFWKILNIYLLYGYLRKQSLCESILTVPVCSLFILRWNLKVHQLHEFAIYTRSQGGNERWQMMSKLIQFITVHFPDLNPNSYDNLNTMKLDLNVSTKVKFSAKTTKVISWRIRVIIVFFKEFCSASFKGQLPTHFQKWNLLHLSYSYV